MTDLIKLHLNDILLERPVCFVMDDSDYAFYPLTLGKMIFLHPYMQDLGLQMGNIPQAEFLRVAKRERRKCAKILAVYAAKTKDDIFSSTFTDLIETFSAMRPKDMASSLLALLSQPDVNAYKKHLGIDKEEKRMRKVAKVKDNKNTYTFGGVSMYGTIIDRACERYGWTYDYVMWGISLINLQLMLADSMQSIFLTDKEARRCRISNDRNIINGDSREQMEAFIRSQSWR